MILLLYFLDFQFFDIGGMNTFNRGVTLHEFAAHVESRLLRFRLSFTHESAKFKMSKDLYCRCQFRAMLAGLSAQVPSVKIKI